ncbi:MAG TPA: hypothetical protein VHC41_03930, partial [Mycobacteriales bacterium]|nr:hypothetical protein [Mycobacteriales bacterium]
AFARDVAQGLALLAAQLDGVPAGLARTDAQGRLARAKEIAATGRGVPVLRAARHTLLEGLAAAYDARSASGLPVGAPPPPPNDAPVTAEPVDVVVDGRTYRALPAYRPGSVHHFAGGDLAGVSVPGGWYETPFWEPLLVADTEKAQLAGLDADTTVGSGQP